jgi:putative FmdB family regulatory protein
MPLYEYQCDACGGRFERIRKFSDPPLDEPCPSCGGTVQKLISSPAIQFKGKGWYVTDYAKAGSTGTSKSDSAASEAKADAKSDATKKESSSDSKGESKPETKTETKTEAAKPAAPAPKKD